MEAGNIQHLQPIAERNAREEVVTAFIGIRRVCEISGLSKSSILRRVKAGTFPRPALEEANTVRYDLAEVMAWRADQFKKRAQRIEAEAAQPEAGA